MSGLASRVNGRCGLIVIGGSAGALEPLRRIVSDLPSSLPAAVCVVVHTGQGSAQLMAGILERSGKMPASYPQDGDALLPGHIYVAPRDRHLLIQPDGIRLTRGPKENGFRPAIDPLFRTAAAALGSRVIGLILSGGQNDGALGLAAISDAGGVTVAQSPDNALVPGMPTNAIEHVDIDYIIDADEMPALLVKLVNGRRKKEAAPRAKKIAPLNLVDRSGKPDPAEAGTDLAAGVPDLAGPPSVFVCPECGGPLWETDERGVLRYRCHVGHSYTGDVLVGAQADALEHALWTALRTLEETAALRRRMSSHARSRGWDKIASRFTEDSDDFERRAAIVRKALVLDEPLRDDDRVAETVARRARRATKP